MEYVTAAYTYVGEWNKLTDTELLVIRKYNQTLSNLLHLAGNILIKVLFMQQL